MTYTKFSLSEEEIRWRSKEITSFFLNSDVYKGCKSVHLYQGYPDEVTTLYILDHIKKSHRDYFFPTKDPYQNQRADVIVVPGRKFDSYMNRKGRGQGYYDRFLANADLITKVGVCFELQMVNQLRSKPHDIPMDMVITEKGIYKKRGLGINQVPFSVK